jgi:branched-chain amino acid transport system substrate-binding protein
VIGGAVAATSAAMSPVAEKKQVSMLSLAAADTIVKPVTQHRYVFKLGPDASAVAGLITTHLADRHIRSIGVLAENGPYGEAGLAALTGSGNQVGVKITIHDRLPLTTANYQAQAQTIASHKVDAVVIWSQAPIALLAATALRDVGYHGDRYFDSGAAADDVSDLKNSPVMNGGLFVAPEIMSAGSEMANTPSSYSRKMFFNDFTRRFGAISTFAVFGADALRMVGTAAEWATDPTRLRVRNELESKPFYLLGGSYTFSTINHGGVQPDELTLLQLSATGWTLV